MPEAFLKLAAGDRREVPAVAAPEDKALSSLSLDYARMLEDGLLFDDAEPFEKLPDQCKALEARANKSAQQHHAPCD